MIYLPDTLSIEERREYFRRYAPLVAMFGHECVDRELLQIPVRDLVELQECQHKQDSWGRDSMATVAPWQKPARHLGCERRMVEVHHPTAFDYTKWDYRLCDLYMVPHRYQGLMHNKIIVPCLLERAPWLADFKIKVYEYHDYKPPYVEEFYVGLGESVRGHRSLYVPYYAFLTNDAEAVRERTRKYLMSYDTQHGQEIADEMLATDVAKRFLACLEGPPR